MALTWDTVHLADDAALLAALDGLALGIPSAETTDDRALAGRVFHQIMRRRLPVFRDLVVRLLDTGRDRESVVGLCVWSLDRHDALDLLRPLLDDAGSRPAAVWALGTLVDTDSADRLLDLLDEAKPGLESGRLLVALGRLDTPRVRETLARRATRVDADELYYLNRALRRLTGHSPLAPDQAGDSTIRQAQVAATRSYWRTADPAVRPAPLVTWRLRDAAQADITVEHGRDVFALDDAHPSRPGSWPLWYVAWTMGGCELATVGSGCGTCEVYLHRTGWAPSDAVAFAQSIRATVEDVPELTPGLMAALEPVLAGAATGRFLLRLADVRLLATHDQRETWYGAGLRVNPAEDDDLPMPGADSEGALYAGLSTSGALTALTVAATQPDDVLRPETVAAYATRIAAGDRPAVLVSAHAADRYVIEADDREDRSVTGFVIDGHHKLAAYDRLGLPARVLMLCDLWPRLDPGTADLRGLFDAVLDGVAVPVT